MKMENACDLEEVRGRNEMEVSMKIVEYMFSCLNHFNFGLRRKK